MEPPVKRESASKNGYATAKIREGDSRVNLPAGWTDC
jgi:hypothetical protein